MQSCEEIVEQLKTVKTSLFRRYGISDVAIFGPFSKDEAQEGMSIDLLITFKHPIGMRFIDLEDELEQLLNNKVNITTRKGIEKKYLKDIRKEMVAI